MKGVWQVLENHLCNYRNTCLDVQRFLRLYKDRCNDLFLSVVSCASFDEAQGYFDEIYYIQHKLSIVKYKYGFPLSDEIDLFVYEFERDDVYSRKYWYEELIRRGGYGWPS